MTENETTAILAILKTAYPQQLSKITSVEAEAMIKLWAVQFHNIPSDIVMLAVQKIIGTSEFFPSIKEIKKKISGLHCEAWSLIQQHEQACDGEWGIGTKLSESAYKKVKYIYDNTYHSKEETELSLVDCIGGKYIDGVIECNTPLLELDFKTEDES